MSKPDNLKRKLILIDGNAILHRAFHALPPLTTKKGEPINAVYGLVSMLVRIILDLNPTHIAVTFDRKEKTFRQKEYINYQSHRPEMDDDLSIQFQKARDFLSAAKIPFYSVAGFEADDVIGTLATGAVKENFEVNIVTGDRDILQLVEKGIKVYMPVKGVSEGKLYGEEDVIDRMGCLPSQIVDYKALVGDSSDNYPGVPGIGPKTASGLLKKYKSFENIYKNLNEIPENTRKRLIEGKEKGDLSYRLAKIIKDVPLNQKEKMDEWVIDSKEVLDLFGDFGFRTLTRRVQEVGQKLRQKEQLTLI